MNTIGIIDYGMGNLRSVQKACERLGVRAEICPTPDELRGHAKWILPGVGAFRDAIAALRQHGFEEPIREHVQRDRPLLGICLGLQLLFDRSYEDGEHTGLKIVRGEVMRFESQPGLKIPHMGWNSLQIERPNPLLEGVSAGEHVYFVHSYHVVPQEADVVATRTDHGRPFVSMIARGQLYATQFHPEKSQRVGLRLLENFIRL
ncbi:MAG: imidazole glycerol phosphate synthase subunit HisH [Planctomycetaceae bacterium]